MGEDLIKYAILVLVLGVVPIYLTIRGKGRKVIEHYPITILPVVMSSCAFWFPKFLMWMTR